MTSALTADTDQTLATLLRIADALERIAPPARKPADLTLADAFVWHPAGSELAPVARVKNYITPSGLQRLKDEHQFLLTRERPAVTAVVAWAAVTVPTHNGRTWRASSARR